MLYGKLWGRKAFDTIWREGGILYVDNNSLKEHLPTPLSGWPDPAGMSTAEPVVGPTALPSRGEASSKVAILLGTFDGQRFLREQLASFEAQSHGNWEVWASDDGSRDGTQAILASYREKWGTDRLSIHAGPAAGFVANFLSLTCNPSIQADHYAFADQDDIWEPDKLARALAWLESVPAHIPALYCSRTRLVDIDNRDIGFSPLFSRPPRFSNALVQSLAGGNTMVFNDAARRLLRLTDVSLGTISHDWWAYQVVTGVGGKVKYDAEPSIRYRQHGANLVGANSDLKSRLVRARWLLNGRFRSYSDKNIEVLQQIRAHLTPVNRRIFDDFVSARESVLPVRIFKCWRAGIHRQTFIGNLGLIAAILLNKI